MSNWKITGELRPDNQRVDLFVLASRCALTPEEAVIQALRLPTTTIDQETANRLKVDTLHAVQIS